MNQPPPPSTRLAARVVAFAGGPTVALLLVSCAAREPIEVAPPPLPAAFSETGGEILANRWWEAFGDPLLNAQVEQALGGNFTIEAAWRRLQAARAVSRREGADLRPTLDGEAGLSRTLERTGQPTEGSNLLDYDWSDSGTKSIGLAASYELDLWGRVASLRDAARLDERAAAADVQAAALSISAEIARAWFELQEQQEQLRVLHEQEQTSQKTLDLVLIRFRRGDADTTDVWQQEQLIESRRGDREEVLARIAELRNRLAVLRGESPGGPAPEPGPLATPPPLPSTGTPAELVQRRPDVRAAMAAIEAADRRVAAALADRYPRVSLSAGLDTTGPDWRDLFDNWAATLASNVTAPLLDGGRRSAEVDRTRALLAEGIAAYAQNVLEALEEVENALANEAAQARLEQSLLEQARLARDVRSRLEERYLRGAADFLQTLDSLERLQTLERDILSARLDRMLARVDLCRALSGGWSLPEPAPLDPASSPNGGDPT